MAFNVECFEDIEPFYFVALGDTSFDDYATYFSCREAKQGNKDWETCGHIGEDEPTWGKHWYFLAYQPIN